MARGVRNRFELRAEVEAAEARGVMPAEPKRKPRSDSDTPRAKPSPGTARMKVVWAVCDVGGRAVSKFDYPDKAAAEAFAAALKAKGKGEHFVRSLKEPMNS